MQTANADRLTIWSVPGFASQWLSHELVSFGEAHKNVEIELHPADVLPDFLQNEADCDIRYYGDAWDSPPTDRLLRSIEIARPRILAVASPEFVASFGPLDHPTDLLDVPLLHEEHDEQWRAWFGANGVVLPGRLPGDRMWHAHLALTSARLGAGVALASTFLLGDDLAAGRLVEVAAPSSEQPPIVLGGYVLVGRRDRWDRPMFAALRSWLCSAAAEKKEQQA
jgi:DNA-binding transcriptional LysR family regulator